MSTVTQAVVITGASSGIGKSSALFLAERGFRVFAGVRKDSDAQTLRTESNDNLIPIMLDVTKEELIHQATQTVSKQLDGVHVLGLVNNAGVTASGPVEFLPLDDLRALWEVNVIGIVTVTQAFMPLLRQVQRGHIINISSFGGTISSPFLSPYHASKFALEAISDSLRMELKPWNINVTVLKPASIKTPIWDKAVNEYESLMARMPPEAQDYYGDALKKVTQSRQDFDAKGGDPQIVAEALYKVLSSPTPPTRRLLALNPFIFAFLRWLPDRWRDRLVMNSLGL